MNTEFDTVDSMITALTHSGRSHEIPESLDAYGWLVGSWELDVRHYWTTDVSARGIKCEVHAHWVLEGRGRAGCLDHAASSRSRRSSGQNHEYVWHVSPRMGPLNSVLAHYMEESCGGSSRRTDWTQ